MASIEFCPEEYLDEVSTETLLKELVSRDKTVPPGAGDGDPPTSRYVDAAARDARDWADCPQSFKDLLWHVHRRAVV